MNDRLKGPKANFGDDWWLFHRRTEISILEEYNNYSSQSLNILYVASVNTRIVHRKEEEKSKMKNFYFYFL